MKLNKYQILCFFLIAIAFSITVLAVTSVAAPIGADTYFHLDIASYYSRGDFAGGMNYSLSNNFFPYPPLTHLMEVPLFWSGNTYLCVRILEGLLLPITFSLTLWLVNKYSSPKAAFITGLILLGNLAFVDGAMQLRPESLDLLLYPLMIAAVLTVKKKTFAGLAIATVYSHGIAALCNIYGVAIKLLFKRQPAISTLENGSITNMQQKYPWRKTILAATAIIVPLLIISVIYIEGAFQKWFTLAGANQSNPQQTLFWTNPLFIPLYSGLTLIGLIYLVKPLYNKIRHHNWNISPLESLLSWGVVASAIMVPFWADRWLQYITIPLAILVGLNLQNMKGWKQIPIYTILIAIAAAYITYWLGVGLLGGWAMRT